MQNLAELVGRLIAARVEFVLVGGFAAIAHGVIAAKEAINRDHDRITVKDLKEIKKRQQQS